MMKKYFISRSLQSNKYGNQRSQMEKQITKALPIKISQYEQRFLRFDLGDC